MLRSTHTRTRLPTDFGNRRFSPRAHISGKSLGCSCCRMTWYGTPMIPNAPSSLSCKAPMRRRPVALDGIELRWSAPKACLASRAWSSEGSASCAPRFDGLSRGRLHDPVEFFERHLFVLAAAANAHPALGCAGLVELGSPVLYRAVRVDQEIDDAGVLFLLAVNAGQIARLGAEVADVLHDLVAAFQLLAADQLAEVRVLVHHLGVRLADGTLEMRVVDA